MDFRSIIIIVITLIIGLGIGYALVLGMMGSSTTTVTVPTTFTETKTSVKTTVIPTTLVYTVTTTSTYEKTVVTPTTLVTTIAKPVTLTITSIVNETVTKTIKLNVVYDVLGRPLSFSRIPERIVCLAPSITELVFALGLGDKVIGVDDYSNYPPEINELVDNGKIQRVGGYWNPDLEKTVELKPDLVLASVNPHARLLQKFEELGLKVVFLRADNARNAYDVYQDIILVASIFDVEEKAKKIIDNIQSTIDNITSTLVRANATPARTFIILGPPSWGLWTSGGDTFIDYVVSVSGGVNIAKKYSGWVKLDYEEVLAQDPEVIIVGIMGSHEDAENVLNDIANSPLNQTTAYKNGNIYVFTGDADDVLTRPGPRISLAVEILSHVLHPELFGEINRSDVVKMSRQETSAYNMGLRIVSLDNGVSVEY